MRNRFKVFLSVDMEGMSGVSSWQELKKESPAFPAIRKSATDEVNAAIRGIRKARPDICDIVVCDAHADGENLLIDNLEQGIQLVKGTPRVYYMMHGIDRTFSLGFFIGYHAMAGTHQAGMDHTYSSASIYSIKINGRYVGETEINAALAGYYGVPIGLVTGDSALHKEIKKFFTSPPEIVVTKYGVSQFAASCRHPRDVHQEIEEKAAQAVTKASSMKCFTFTTPIRAEFTLTSSLVGDMTELVPGMKRISARIFSLKTKNILEFYRIMRLVCSLGFYAKIIST